MPENEKQCNHGSDREECEICQGLFRAFIEMLEEGNNDEQNPWEDYPFWLEWPYRT